MEGALLCNYSVRFSTPGRLGELRRVFVLAVACMAVGCVTSDKGDTPQTTGPAFDPPKKVVLLQQQKKPFEGPAADGSGPGSQRAAPQAFGDELGSELIAGAAQATQETLAYCSAGRSSFNAGDYKGAVESYTRCIDGGGLREDYLAYVLKERGKAFSRLREHGSARVDFIQSISRNPADAEVQFELGVVHYRTGRTHDAISRFTRALDLDKNQTAAWSMRGLAYESLGNTEKAVRDFRRSYRLGGHYKEIVRKLMQNNVLAGFQDAPGIRMELPEDFVLGHHGGNSFQRIVEYVPKGETVHNWTRMVTMTIARIPPAALHSYGDNPHMKFARDVKDKIFTDYRAVCGQSRFVSNNVSKKRGGGFNYFYGELFCDDADLTRMPSQVHMLENSFLSVRVYAWHTTLLTVQYAFQSNDNLRATVSRAQLDDPMGRRMFGTMTLPHLPSPVYTP